MAVRFIGSCASRVWLLRCLLAAEATMRRRRELYGARNRPLGASGSLDRDRSRDRWNRFRAGTASARGVALRRAARCRQLHWRALVSAVGTEDTAVARLRSQQDTAPFAVEKIHARVRWHALHRRVPALRTGQERGGFSRCHFGEPRACRRLWTSRAKTALSNFSRARAVVHAEPDAQENDRRYDGATQFVPTPVHPGRAVIGSGLSQLHGSTWCEAGQCLPLIA